MCPASFWECGFEYVGELRVGNVGLDIPEVSVSVKSMKWLRRQGRAAE